MKINMAQGWETGNYNEETCNNGGGYWQFEGWASFANKWSVAVQDTSCGDFGTRCHAQFYAPDGQVYCIGVGSMDDASIDNEDAEEVFNSIRQRYGADMWDLLYEASFEVDMLARRAAIDEITDD